MSFSVFLRSVLFFVSLALSFQKIVATARTNASIKMEYAATAPVAGVVVEPAPPDPVVVVEGVVVVPDPEPETS